MSTYNSGLLVMSAVASSSGLQSVSESVFRLSERPKVYKRAKRRNYSYTPLDPQRKEELLQSILHDDWHE